MNKKFFLGTCIGICIITGVTVCSKTHSKNETNVATSVIEKETDKNLEMKYAIETKNEKVNDKIAEVMPEILENETNESKNIMAEVQKDKEVEETVALKFQEEYIEQNGIPKENFENAVEEIVIPTEELKHIEETNKDEEILQEEQAIIENTNEDNELINDVKDEVEETLEQQTEKSKSIYDYPFNVQAIKQELINLGESMGLTHITKDEDRIIAPSNSSWACPIRARRDFDGEYLERALKDMVNSTPKLVVAYGGNPIEYFTIYVEENANDEVVFYFLH